MNREEITDLIDGCMSIDDMNEVHRLIDEIEQSKDELLMEALTKYVRLYEYKLSNIETDDFYEKAQDYRSKNKES